ncbi:uncharacterized protein [Henckelia pumila]|uniref:uncharacterized protein n=1 Tax=Henckelia pumila TaxID=405737 RepID=UPI003C6E3650
MTGMYFIFRQGGWYKNPERCNTHYHARDPPVPPPTAADEAREARIQEEAALDQAADPPAGAHVHAKAPRGTRRIFSAIFDCLDELRTGMYFSNKLSEMLWKSFNLFFSKFKCLPTTTDHHESLSCYQKSLTSTSTPASAVEDFFSSAGGDSDTDYVPNFASVFASQRFFFSTPGSSNSIFEQVPRTLIVSGGVAVQKYSPDPYADFRKSMQEMVEAQKLKMDVESSWEFLHELLCCYFTLNPKHTHKFIVDAFADIVLSLAAPPRTCRKALSRLHHRQLLERIVSEGSA